MQLLIFFFFDILLVTKDMAIRDMDNILRHKILL